MQHTHVLITESADYFLYGVNQFFVNDEPQQIEDKKSAIAKWGERLWASIPDTDRIGVFSFELINGVFHQPAYATVDYVNPYVLGIPKKLSQLGITEPFTGLFSEVQEILNVSGRYGIRTICAALPSYLLFKTQSQVDATQLVFQNLGAQSNQRFNLLKEQLNSNRVYLSLESLSSAKNGSYEARVNFVPQLVEALKQAGMQPILGMAAENVAHFGWQDLCERADFIYSDMPHHTVITFEQHANDLAQKIRAITAFNYAFIFDMVQVEIGFTSHEVIQNLIPHLNKIMMCSKYSCRQLERLAPESARITDVGYVAVNVPQCPSDAIEHVRALGDFYFIVGNGHYYKLLHPTVKKLCEHFPDKHFVVLGYAKLKEELPYDNLTCLQSGSQSDELIDALYFHAQALIYPSCYEGLGYPWMKALLIGQTAFTLNNALVDEALEAYQLDAQYLHKYSSLEELCQQLHEHVGQSVYKKPVKTTQKTVHARAHNILPLLIETITRPNTPPLNKSVA